MPDERGSGGTDPTMTPEQALGEAATRVDTGSGASGASTSQRSLGGSAPLPSRYAPGQRLGAGGMGEVVLARDEQIGRDVAIKRMRVEPTPNALARFLREAKIQGRLDHPAIVPVHELANDADGKPFFVMKRLTGTTLTTIMADGKLSRQKLLRAFADVCLAIEFAHRRGVIHRDLKPDNIMLGDFGEVYVLDWGVAHVDSESDSLHDGGAVAAGEEGATEVGAILGTPGFIAPELVRGEEIDDRADVFALGAILFEILAGQPLVPRGRGGLTAVVAEFDARPSARAADRECPPELEAIVVRATSPDRTKRPTARELGDQVERFLDGDRDVALRKNLAATHLEAARVALASGRGTAERATAMREAGRAIALDPHDNKAAELVGRLMLEPPPETPPDVAAKIEAAQDMAVRSKLRVMSVIMPTFLAVVPAAWIIGVRSWTAVAWFVGVTLINCAYTWYVAFRKAEATPFTSWIAAILYGGLVFTIGREFSPFLFAPTIAAISIVLFVVDPRAPWKAVVALQLMAVLGSWLVELFDLLPHTMNATATGELVLHSAMVNITIPGGDIAIAVFIGLTMIAAGAAGRQVAVSARDAMERTELQAWHLRQLVKH